MNKRTQSGFTIIELMMTLVVAAIMLTFAVPSMQAMVANNRLTTATNTLVGDFNLARSEAIKRNRSAYITALNPVAANEFGGGYRVWLDRDDDATFDADEEVRISQGAPGGVTIDSVGGLNQIEYLPNGTGNGLAAAVFNICDNRTGENGRQVQISVVGRVETNRQFACP